MPRKGLNESGWLVMSDRQATLSLPGLGRLRGDQRARRRRCRAGPRSRLRRGARAATWGTISWGAAEAACCAACGPGRGSDEACEPGARGAGSSSSASTSDHPAGRPRRLARSIRPEVLLTSRPNGRTTTPRRPSTSSGPEPCGRDVAARSSRGDDVGSLAARGFSYYTRTPTGRDYAQLFRTIDKFEADFATDSVAQTDPMRGFLQPVSCSSTPPTWPKAPTTSSSDSVAGQPRRRAAGLVGGSRRRRGLRAALPRPGQRPGPARRGAADLLRRRVERGLGVLLLHGARRAVPAAPGLAAPPG